MGNEPMRWIRNLWEKTEAEAKASAWGGPPPT